MTPDPHDSEDVSVVVLHGAAGFARHRDSRGFGRKKSHVAALSVARARLHPGAIHRDIGEHRRENVVGQTRGGCPTGLFGFSETRRSDRISLRRNDMWTRLGRLDGALQRHWAWTILDKSRVFQACVHRCTRPAAPAGRHALRGKEAGSRRQKGDRQEMNQQGHGRAHTNPTRQRRDRPRIPG
jgi:hypothetical protein